jgi:hypothetical protein
MDRTSEFLATVESLRSRAQPNIPSDKRRLLSPIEQQSASSGHADRQRSDFAVMASLIGKDIQAMAAKLQKLARRKSHLAFSMSQHPLHSYFHLF